MSRRVGFFQTMVLAWWCVGLAACAETGTGGSTYCPEPIPIPQEGRWVGNAVDFVVEEGRITQVTFRGFGCLGTLTPANVPLCSSLLLGDLWVDLPITEESELEWNSLFGLHLSGRFEEDKRFLGTYDYVADNACCVGLGAWEAVHESIVEKEVLEPCHGEVTGEETLELGLTNGGRFVALTDGDTLPVVEGFQGAAMLVLSVRAAGIAVGSLTADLWVELEETGVYGEVHSPSSPFAIDNSGLLFWNEILVLLYGEDGELLDPHSDTFEPLVQGRALTLKVRVQNACGFGMTTSKTLVGMY